MNYFAGENLDIENRPSIQGGHIENDDNVTYSCAAMTASAALTLP